MRGDFHFMLIRGGYKKPTVVARLVHGVAVCDMLMPTVVAWLVHGVAVCDMLMPVW